jgi:hypothetical protein
MRGHSAFVSPFSPNICLWKVCLILKVLEHKAGRWKLQWYFTKIWRLHVRNGSHNSRVSITFVVCRSSQWTCRWLSPTLDHSHCLGSAKTLSSIPLCSLSQLQLEWANPDPGTVQRLNTAGSECIMSRNMSVAGQPIAPRTAGMRCSRWVCHPPATHGKQLSGLWCPPPNSRAWRPFWAPRNKRIRRLNSHRDNQRGQRTTLMPSEYSVQVKSMSNIVSFFSSACTVRRN